MNQTDFDLEVDRRIAALRANPDSLLQRFDTNQDGRIDGQEMAAVRAVVAHEILTGAQATNSPLVVRDRFEFLSELGHGAQGVTHLARDLQSGDLVAVKVMNLKTAREWKAIDLFHREVAALRQLSHPQIPAFIDAFDIDETEFYLVQAFVPGDNLQVRLARQELIDATRLRDIADQLMEVLGYLHSQSPPVLHRDVKPANIIINDDGRVSLVDFGAVQNQGSRGTTVVGTTGYMPPEQLMGAALPASDVFAAGAMLVHVATRVHPVDMPLSHSKMLWRDRAQLPEYFANWIDRLISPAHEDRPRDATEARRWLHASKPESKTGISVLHQQQSLESSSNSPRNKISTSRNGDELTLTIQPSGWMRVGLTSAATVTPALLSILYLYNHIQGPLLWGGVLFAALFAFSRYWHNRKFQVHRRLVISPQKTTLFVDALTEFSIPTHQIKGPVLHQGRHKAGLFLAHHEDDEVQIVGQLHPEELEWTAHQIRKHLSLIKS